ncbi:P-loop containing nucleoside triphosphate hydrolase protein [Lactarius tabidus]
MSTGAVNSVPSLSECLQYLWSCSGDELTQLVSDLYGLSKEDKTICYCVALLCYCVTLSMQIPCEMQLRVVLTDQHKKDSLVSAGTGSGKTLLIILNALLDAPDKQLVTLVISPLKCLQVTQENNFNTQYGIPAVLINEDTPRENTWWTENIWNSRNRSPGTAQILIVTAEQLFKSHEGHLPCLAILLHNHSVQKHVTHVIIDEAHNIYTAGLPHYGHIEKNLLKTGCVSIHVSSNHPNMTYATHKVINNIENLCNYECFLAVPFSISGQPWVLIFVNNKGIVKHYHSKMSSRYLELTHTSFTTQTGICCILIATLSQSVGVDFPDVKIVCTVGLPGMTVDTLQHAGRALRNSDDNALFIIFYKPWVQDIALSEYTEGDLLDPDCPRGKLRSHAQQCEQAPLSSLRLVKGPECLHSKFANYLGDTSVEGSVPVAVDLLDLQDFLPGTFPYVPPPRSPTQKAKRPQNIYCPVQEHPFLKHCLIRWLELVHSEDPLCSCTTLVWAHLSKFNRAEDITLLLEQTTEWASEWSHGLYEVITQFDIDYACISEKRVVQRKQK